jgi:hypothetical protein
VIRRVLAWFRPPRCRARHPDHRYITCVLDPGHTGDHDGDFVTWPQKPAGPAVFSGPARSLMPTIAEPTPLVLAADRARRDLLPTDRPPADRYTNVSPECSVGDCDRCSTPADCECGHHTPATENLR